MLLKNVFCSDNFKYDHTFSYHLDVGPSSVNFIRLQIFCFLPFLISLLNLHDQLDLLLVFNLDDLFHFQTVFTNVANS